MSDGPLVTVPLRARSALADLFASHRELRAVIECVLEGGAGDALTDGAERPAAARLSIGCYEIFGGDAGSLAAARLAQALPAPRELLYGNDPAWRQRLLEAYGGRLSDRPMQAFDSSRLAAVDLRAVARVPEGFDSRRLDVRLAGQLDWELEPHALQVYPSPEAFVTRGVGFGAVQDGQLASAATSYAACASRVEVAIATRPMFRGLGLARAMAAALLLHCLDQGLRPHWNASNPVSRRLALRLGLQPAGLCEVLFLHLGPEPEAPASR